MDHFASSKAGSKSTTISFPDIPKDACVVQICTVPVHRREAGRSSSLIIIICGPTSLHQDIIRELPNPLTASTKWFLLTLDEIRGYIKCTKGAMIITQSMLCNGWVIRPSLGAPPTPGVMNSPIIGKQLCRRIAHNVSPLIQHLSLHGYLGSDAASSSPAGLDRNDESLNATQDESRAAVLESCNAFLSIPTKRPLFNLYEALDDWARLCGDRRGNSMSRLWEHWQLLPHARTDNDKASTELHSTLEFKRTQAQILALLEQNIFGEQLIRQLFELDPNSTWNSMNDKLDRVIQKSVHCLAMINFASVSVTLEGLPTAQTRPLYPTELTLSTTLSDEERAFVNGISSMFSEKKGTASIFEPTEIKALGRYLWNNNINKLPQNQPHREEAIGTHLGYIYLISVVAIIFLRKELVMTPTVARQVSIQGCCHPRRPVPPRSQCFG
ncbi:hypothetical protein FSARC_14232 [Fusarium sarcochroum]|uniref:Uncharacterized protein n=1 Tax=Fusarium sarcochroum TaxID=1208366 RepID=A0A8H4SVJ0_9HYPO|nr:hypothetical protein FSARC_14232 [Fusarium sarcochroum]